jgi:hypothetical protein
MFTLYALRIELDGCYRQTIDLPSEMSGVLEEVGLARLPHFTALRDWFEKFPTNEEAVGQAIADSVVPREDVFLVTKVLRQNLAPDDVLWSRRVHSG